MASRIDGSGVNTISQSQYLKIAAEIVLAEKEIAQATEVLAAARGVKSGIFKRAKQAGADVDALKHLRKLAKLDDEDRQSLLSTTAQYAAWEGVSFYTPPTEDSPQGSMFDAEAAEAKNGLDLARIDTDAWNTRRAGGLREGNPHEAGTREYDTWDRAWLDADKEIKKITTGVVKVKASTQKKPAKLKDSKVVKPINPAAPLQIAGPTTEITIDGEAEMTPAEIASNLEPTVESVFG